MEPTGLRPAARRPPLAVRVRGEFIKHGTWADARQGLDPCTRSLPMAVRNPDGVSPFLEIPPRARAALTHAHTVLSYKPHLLNWLLESFCYLAADFQKSWPLPGRCPRPQESPVPWALLERPCHGLAGTGARPPEGPPGRTPHMVVTVKDHGDGACSSGLLPGAGTGLWQG